MYAIDNQSFVPHLREKSGSERRVSKRIHLPTNLGPNIELLQQVLMPFRDLRKSTSPKRTWLTTRSKGAVASSFCTQPPERVWKMAGKRPPTNSNCPSSTSFCTFCFTWRLCASHHSRKKELRLWVKIQFYISAQTNVLEGSFISWRVVPDRILFTWLVKYSWHDKWPFVFKVCIWEGKTDAVPGKSSTNLGRSGYVVLYGR